jgi:phage tail-like protein
MSITSGNSATVHNFAIQIDGVTCAYFSKVSGLSLEQDVIEHVQNTLQGKPRVSKMPGISRGGEVTVTRGADMTPDFKNWINQSLQGDMAVARKNVSIIQQDYMGGEIRRFNLINAWCRSHSYGDFEAGGSSVSEETVVITYEDLIEA